MTAQFTTPIAIDSRRYLTDTGLHLSADSRYRMEATGRWVDFYVPCGPQGFADPILNGLSGPLKRAPASLLFALMGVLQDGTRSLTFEIGAGIDFRPPFDGRLFCFANDVPWAYWNNYGTVHLTVHPF